jgi:anti-sigma factor RsiW
MNHPIASDLNPHQEAEELLPWYTTGQLEGADQALVEQHLSGCAECRRQLAFDRRMIDELAALMPEVDTGWARLRQRLEKRQSWWHKVGHEASAAWRTLARPSVAALAFAQLLFVVVAGATLLSLSRPSYHALASAPPPQSANVIAMFRPNTTESQIRELLQGNGASLVGGPTPADAYLLRVPARSRQAVLQRLRSDSHVLMAQPIDGNPS